MTYFQQGDIILSMIEKLPNEIEEQKTDLIHKGENHHHRMKGPFQVFGNAEKMFVLCEDECELFHEEHKTIKIPEGLYEKKIVLEYDHFLEESRQVID